jgi:uncharacterized membrane protein YbhN (UPF0104 family)
VAIRLAVTAAILIYLAFQIDMRAAGLAVVRVHPGYLGFVLALVACDRGVMILRWVLLLKASGVPIATKSAARIFLVSSFVGSFLPAGVGGDIARAYGLARATANGGEALASVAIDRVLGIVALVTMGVIGLMSSAGTLADWRVLSAALLLLSASVAIFWADRIVGALLPGGLKPSGIGRYAFATAEALSRYRSRPGTLALVLLWSVVVQLLRIIQAYCLGLGLGLTVPFRYYLVFMPVGLLMLLLPISISGFGLPQGVIVWLMRPLGVAHEASFALSTLIVLTGLAGNLPGALLWLRQRREIP